ncbi:MAG: hypothetical protein LBB82_09120 [Treponema sp.]|jgi:hypothetical protein|nr:hypothetical protein [Treponema sp.]
MKHVNGLKAVLAAVVTVFVLAGCSKPAPPETTDEASGENQESQAEFIAGPVLSPGVILSQASLWELKDDGNVYWKKTLNAGDTVTFKGEERRMTRMPAKVDHDFILIESDGQDLWVIKGLVAGDAIPGVILYPDTVLYSKAVLDSPVTSKNNIIPQYTIVGVHSGLAENSFSCISAYLSENWVVIDKRFVKQDTLSTSDNQVQGMKLYRLALATENPVVKKELLNNALQVGSSFEELISEELYKLANAPAETETAE